MDYYVQGDAANADKIKAAFKAKGIDTRGYEVNSEYNLYYSSNGLLYFENFSNALLNVFKNNPDYKELELPVEPTFKVGDWVVKKDGEIFYGGNYAEQITLIEVDDKGKCIWLSSKTWVRDDVIRPWTIADAKDGDVLAINWHEDGDSWEKIIIFKKYHTKGVKGLFNRPCVQGYGNTFKNGKLAFDEEVPYYSKTWTDKLQPATKEQRDLLFTKMKEAGYEWDADKKELKEIQSHYDIADFHAGMPVLQRSGNDEHWDYNIFSRYLNNNCSHPFILVGCHSRQCIPFEGNERLLGTTDMPSEEYINW